VLRSAPLSLTLTDANVHAPPSRHDASARFETRIRAQVVPPNALRGGYKRLQEPVGPIHFAGEAFHARYPGSAHGAYLSGCEAASAIVAALARAPPPEPFSSPFCSKLDSARRHASHNPSSGTSSPSVRSDGAGSGSVASTPRSLSLVEHLRGAFGGRLASVSPAVGQTPPRKQRTGLS